MQPDAMDCGPTCLKMIAKYYGREVSLEKLRKLSETTREGTSLRALSDTAEKMGFRSLGVKIDYLKLENEAPLPCIAFWQQKHFVVIYKIKKGSVHIADPAQGLTAYSKQEFILNWIGPNASTTTEEGIVLLLEPSPKLFQIEQDDIGSKKGFAFLYQYLFRYKKFQLQLFIGLLAGSLLQLIFPFLTQSVVDIGIQNQDLNFIYLILVAQLCLFFGRTGIEIVRGWILLHLSARINISLISDFFIKLMKLPISFFDIKITGDIMQRINDHQRIENLLTTSSLNVLFSFFNLVVFGAVLFWYDWRIFLIFLIGSIFYFIWILLFLKKRKRLDYKKFSYLSDEQSKVIEIINGMQDLKLHNAEKQKRWSWEYLQARLFKVSVENLSLQQVQIVGSNFINELKNIIISFFSAKLVIDGNITLGMMMAISYIIGQLNSPIQQMILFIYTLQDAKIALERLSEIHNKKSEDIEHQTSTIPMNVDVKLNKVDFRYLGNSDMTIKNLSLTIPSQKITAIVGPSGSGKSTLIKLLLKFYDPQTGNISIGNSNLKNISPKTWRESCGVVMQDSFLFNDTIAGNIAIGEDVINEQKLLKAAEISNVSGFVENLPLAYNTKVGMEGVGLSAGQKQRILIARAIYKDPSFIFFDEATSALDANNEKEIISNLNNFFSGRTAIIVAHRLSTVVNADQIVVLNSGKIIEKGAHEDLIKLNGFYYTLIKNQLELGA